MSNITKKIEVISNIAIIVSAILLGVVFAKRYLYPTPVSSTANDSVIIGKKISLPEVDWIGNGNNLVLFIQSNCRYCTDSAPFYKQLVSLQLSNQNNSQSALQLIAISPEPTQASKAYLDSVGVHIDKVRQADLRSIGVRGTPTLLQVDGSGVITNVWLGQLDKNRETEVLTRLQ